MLDDVIEKNKKQNIKPSLLLHACCAPCSSAVLEYLYKHFNITLFFYNPNISPESEFDYRLEELKRLIVEMNFSDIEIVAPDYDNNEFESLAKGLEDLPEGDKRCKKCYRLRLMKTAEYAKENGFDYFTTTLSVSPYKNAQALNEIGGELEKEYGISYLYSDFKKKEGYKRSCQLSREYKLYRQNYCGCIYSKRAAERNEEKTMTNLKPERVFYYFKQISDVPRGSGNCRGIALYCRNFAINHNLKYIKDDANNVVIFKDGTPGYENSEPVILQGHTDMVCQKTERATTDFINRGLELFVDGDFLKAKETTLGADNGIAVAMILAILESDSIPHPPIEAVFTSDEEIGLIGAGKLDKSVLSAKKMINLDSEEDDTVTVSCAGGCHFLAQTTVDYKEQNGTKITLTLQGLKGGHSGIEINNNRVNADILAGRVLNHLKKSCEFDIINIYGGDKDNAIPNKCVIELCVEDAYVFINTADEYLSIIKAEISDRENGFNFNFEKGEAANYKVLSDEIKSKLIFALTCVPNGVLEMSADIHGLVQTSLNLGILKTENNILSFHFGLRSNKKSGLSFLIEKLEAFFDSVDFEGSTNGHYPPWEYKEDSSLRELYKEIYSDYFGKAPKVEAIHAGLECGVFADAIDGIDCISIGPALYDVHTVNEKLSISSTENVFNILLKILEKLQ